MSLNDFFMNLCENEKFEKLWYKFLELWEKIGDKILEFNRGGKTIS